MAIKMDAQQGSSSHTPFRLTEKHFKNRSQPLKLPSLRQHSVIDLSRPDKQEDDEVWNAGWWSPENDLSGSIRRGKKAVRDKGERPPVQTEGLKRIVLEDGKVGWVVAPGCILIPQYLGQEEQLSLLTSALTKYTLPPNPLSLSTHYALPPNLFELYAEDSQTLISPLHELQRPPTPISAVSNTTSTSTATTETTDSATSSRTSGGSSRTTIETEPGAVVGYEEILAKNKLNLVDQPSEKLHAKTARELLKEIRWANLGWVYQWTTKAYDFTPDVPIPFPVDLKEICTKVVKSIPWSDVFEDDGPEDYSSWKDDYDTGIVNFYQLNDTLMAHVDRAELDPSRPLVSISLGHSTIFLLGSQSRHDLPKPIILRSGDVLIMSGKGRQFYHGVPRILEGTLPATFSPDEGDDLTTRAVKRWISTARVNINARQVFPPGFQRPK